MYKKKTKNLRENLPLNGFRMVLEKKGAMGAMGWSCNRDNMYTDDSTVNEAKYSSFDKRTIIRKNDEICVITLYKMKQEYLQRRLGKDKEQ